jgi:GNAT superfamily N-acetyltransferase
MPIICDINLFENHNAIEIYSKEVLGNSKKIGTYLSYNFYEGFSENEHYLFLKSSGKIIALLVYFFYELPEKIPAIDIIVVSKKFRRKGISKFFYKYLIEKHSALISGCCLNRTSGKLDGSYGLWMKYLIPFHRTSLLNIREKTYESYSHWKAFVSKHNLGRRIIIFKDP